MGDNELRRPVYEAGWLDAYGRRLRAADNTDPEYLEGYKDGAQDRRAVDRKLPHLRKLVEHMRARESE